MPTPQVMRAVRQGQLDGFTISTIAVVLGVSYNDIYKKAITVNPYLIDEVNEIINEQLEGWSVKSSVAKHRVSAFSVRKLMRKWLSHQIPEAPLYRIHLENTTRDPLWDKAFKEFVRNIRSDPGFLKRLNLHLTPKEAEMVRATNELLEVDDFCDQFLMAD